MTAPRSPRTEAGKRLLDALDGMVSELTFGVVVNDILAIEAEAAAHRPGEGLDVETLAYALNRAFGAAIIGGPYNAIGADPMAAAEKLAAEYVRLRENTDAE